MELEFGKNYVVTGFGMEDAFQEDEKLRMGTVITPLEEEESGKYEDFYAYDAPHKSDYGDGWEGDFKVVSIPDALVEYAKKQEIEPGNWVNFRDVYLEEVK